MKLINTSSRLLRSKNVPKIHWILFALVFAIGNAWSNDTLPSHDDEKKPPKAEQKGTGNPPLIIRGEVITKKSPQEIESDATASRDKAAIDGALVRYTGWTTFYTLLLFLVAAVQAGLFMWQLKLMRRSTKDAGDAARAAEKAAIAAEHSIQVSRDAYIASERPWVSVDAAIRTDLFKKQQGIEFGVNFNVKNYGKSPAINVHIFYEVITLKIAADQFGGARQRIAERGDHAKVGKDMGIHLFPSEAKIIPWTNYLSNEEIKNLTYTPLTGLIPSFYVVGAVFYQSAFDEEIHQTGFNYYVCAIDDPLAVCPKGSDVPDFANTFPKERIILEPVPYYKGSID